MARIAIGVLAVLLLCCVRTGPAVSSPPAEPDEAILAKFSPEVRWRLADPTGEAIEAIAELQAPLSPTQLKTLQTHGLDVLHQDRRWLHVKGAAGALYRLAAREEVMRISAPRRMAPSEEVPR